MPIAAALAALLALAGCDDGIDPLFSRQALPPGLALLPADRVGIVVQPVTGVSEPFATEMAAAAADALQQRNVPASLRGGAASSYFLSGDMGMSQNDNGTVTLRVTWDLTGPDGALVGSHTQHRDSPPPSERTGDLLRQMAADAAPQIAAMIQTGAPPPPVAATAAAADNAVSIGAIAGAPGRGEAELEAALIASLPLYGVAVQPGAGDGLRLDGAVTLTPVDAGTERIRLTWRLLDGAGTELGQLAQENDIPAGSLDGDWGEVAYLIADGVAAGIAQIIDRTGG
ncbi:MAG: hypothetical protein R3F55_24025 [Alphaproteobacteria bacterium]